MSSDSIQPFTIDIPKSEVYRLHRKLVDTHLPAREIVPNAGSKYGPPYGWVQKLYETWRNDFDWYKVQERINTASHFTTYVEDIKIHFAHVRSSRDDAIPLLMVHGWPGSFYEFSKVWTPLANPDDSSQPSFHVIVPSLPGFCFSDWPPRAGWTLQDTARIFDQLMKRLGYKTYMVQCGDWGHWIGREMGANDKYSCKLVHFNFAPSPLPDGIELTDREKEVQRRVDDWLENHMGYAICMRTRPHTIGFGFNDNPMGILTWVGEKYLEAADPKRQDDQAWHLEILATASLYFFTGCIMPTMLCYYENVRHENFAAFAMEPQNRITVPFGYTSFYWDTEPSSKRAVERTGNLVWYKGRQKTLYFLADSENRKK